MAGGVELTPKLVADEAQANDKLSIEIVQETARYIAIGAVNMMHTIDPEAVLLGGAMTFGGRESELGRGFLDQVRKVVRQLARPIPAEKTVIDFAMLGADAGFIGAAGVARAEYLKRKS